MIEIQKLSTRFDVRRLDDGDADSVLELCRENTQFYEYCEARPSREQVLQDMHITPPGIQPRDKYYVGFYADDVLAAVMDIIDGYPEGDNAYIGFFMMRKELQGQGTGSSIIEETAAYLKEAGKTAIRLGIDKDNPQSTHFWKKNGFEVISEVDRGGWTVLVAEKIL